MRDNTYVVLVDNGRGCRLGRVGYLALAADDGPILQFRSAVCRDRRALNQ